MPGSVRTASRFAPMTVPPNTGHLTNTAWRMPGRSTSIPNSFAGHDLAGLSTPRCGVPMIRKSLGSLRNTLFKSGAAIVAAVAASAP
jgi:hypothetical protein